MLFRKIIAGIVLACLASPAILLAVTIQEESTQTSSPAEPALVLTGARILTLDGSDPVMNGMIVIVDGKIQAVGKSVDIPEGAKRIDCTGMTITPGLIDSRSRLWMDSASAAQSGGAASLDAFDGLDPFGEDWNDVVRGGVTSVYLQPGNNDVCAGVGVVVASAPSASGQSLTVLKRDAGLQAALGVGNDQSGKGRAAQYERLKKLFTDAKKYQDDWKVWNEYEAKKKADAETPPVTTPESKPAETTGEQAAEKKPDEKPPTKPTEDPVKERLIKVLTGDIPVQMTVNNPDDARRALDLAKEFGLRLILDGLVDTGTAASDLQEKRLPMVLGPWLNASGGNRDLQEFWQTGLANYEGRFAIASFGGSGQASRGLRSHAAQAVAAGCDPDRALAAVTIDAATILGIADQTGSIAAGKRADLAVFAGDPLDVNAAVQMTVVGGAVVYENESPSRVESPLIVGADSVTLPEKLPENYSVTSRRVLAKDGSLAQRTLSVSKGKIVANVAGNTPNGDFRLFDLGDAVVSPGLFAAHASVGLSANDFKANESDARHLSAADGFDPTDRSVSELANTGVLAVMLVPPSQNTLAGRAAIIRVAAQEPFVQTDAGDKFVVSESARTRDRFPATLAGQREMVLSLFTDTPAATRVYLPEVTRQLLIESRAAGTSGLLAGKRLAIFEAVTDAEVRTALDLIEAHRLNAAIFGVENVEKFVDRLVATKTILIVGPASESDQQWRTDDLIAAAGAGVSILWTGDSGLQMRRSAAMAVAAGMDPKVALSTLAGGSLRADSDQADLVIWSGLPTDLRARPLAVIVDGQRVPEKTNGK